MQRMSRGRQSVFRKGGRTFEILVGRTDGHGRGGEDGLSSLWLWWEGRTLGLGVRVQLGFCFNFVLSNLKQRYGLL